MYREHKTLNKKFSSYKNRFSYFRFQIFLIKLSHANKYFAECKNNADIKVSSLYFFSEFKLIKILGFFYCYLKTVIYLMLIEAYFMFRLSARLNCM